MIHRHHFSFVGIPVIFTLHVVPPPCHGFSSPHGSFSSPHAVRVMGPSFLINRPPQQSCPGTQSMHHLTNHQHTVLHHYSSTQPSCPGTPAQSIHQETQITPRPSPLQPSCPGTRQSIRKTGPRRRASSSPAPRRKKSSSRRGRRH